MWGFCGFSAPPPPKLEVPCLIECIGVLRKLLRKFCKSTVRWAVRACCHWGPAWVLVGRHLSGPVCGANSVLVPGEGYISLPTDLEKNTWLLWSVIHFLN